MSPLLTRRRTFVPWREFEDLENRLLRLTEDFGNGETIAGWRPAVDLTESDEEFRLTAEFPGMSVDDIDVEVEEGDLILRGKKEMAEEKEGEDYHVTERSYGEFYRRFSLPSSVDAEKIEAEMKDGVLKVRMPKSEKEAGRKIEISGS